MSDFVDWYESQFGYDPEHECCPDCGDDPTDHGLHAEGCRRIFDPGDPREYLQFEPFAPWPAEQVSA